MRENKKRNRIVLFRVSDAEHQALAAMAATRGLTVSAMIRLFLMGSDGGAVKG